jgi:hypothetical protein
VRKGASHRRHVRLLDGLLTTRLPQRCLFQVSSNGSIWAAADVSSPLMGFAGRAARGYAVRAVVGACLVQSLYAISTWSRTARLIAEHAAALRDVLGAAPPCTPATVSRRSYATTPLLDAFLDRVTALGPRTRKGGAFYG